MTAVVIFPDRSHQAASRAALAIAAIAFALGVAGLAAHANIAFRFPYAFDYGEGVVWQQMRNILAGGPSSPISG